MTEPDQLSPESASSPPAPVPVPAHPPLQDDAMHVHAPDHPVTTCRQFLIHLAIVSIGLLIALSLESLVEARRNIEREISENRGLVKQNIASVQADLKGVEELMSQWETRCTTSEH